MTKAKYEVLIQPTSVYGFKIAKVNVLEAGTETTTIVFEHPFKILAALPKEPKLESSATVTGYTTSTAAPTIATTAKVGDAFLFLGF